MDGSWDMDDTRMCLVQLGPFVANAVFFCINHMHLFGCGMGGDVGNVAGVWVRTVRTGS